LPIRGQADREAMSKMGRVSILKDVILVKGFKQIEVDVRPVSDGLTVFHCHQQLHMDYGFKLLCVISCAVGAWLSNRG
jgi:FtsP/CotA-like multicopper oxidase with cupredoxin domain